MLDFHRATISRTQLCFAVAGISALVALVVLSKSPVSADPSESRQVGFLDQQNGNYITIELNLDRVDVGRFAVAIPGVGVLDTPTAASVSVDGNGTLTVSYSGIAWVDGEAVVDPTFGWDVRRTGAATEVALSVSGTVNSDLATSEFTIEVDAVAYTVSTSPAQHDAEVNAADALDAFAAEDWATVYDLSSRQLRGDESQSQFETDMASETSGQPIIANWRFLTAFDYKGLPGRGTPIARVLLAATMTDESLVVSSLAMIMEGGEWKVWSMDPPAEAVVVSSSSPGAWGFLQETATATGTFTNGSHADLFGSGSARIQLGSTGGGLLGTLLFAGTRLDHISDLSYSTYQPSGNPGTVQTISLQFDMDYNLTDSNTGWQGRLVYEPYFTETVNKGAWQTWDPLQGKWWATGSPGNASCPQSNPCTWAQVMSAFPNAGLRASVGGLSFKAGSGWPANWQGNVDAFVIVVGDEAKAFDFEP